VHQTKIATIAATMIKLKWKYQIISIIMIGLLYVGLLVAVDYFFSEKTNSLQSYIFQGVFFGVFMGLAFPYVSKKFGIRLTSRIGKK
jgi:hypothetical protein